ncbi:MULTISPECIES: hypothetical protein [Enterobacter]|uniref:hypothetical protein n=1 Tax=Enterobacter TaxID=547 RepID=UPI001F3392A9|nr:MULTISPECIES: hypothetical protein [Enterobacter]MCE1268867.1 hypothetical protein [Enterobacter hormaechei]MCW4845248.1 hypothetical protein [Enterobacter hormaechei subsp. xiangfangensis]MCW4863913.1 hypothetical protein [Enterobacter hormaechei subsp. hoffmannii]MDR9888197.1 hypothetical protein [Enterobacter hormaechei subsp. xiangfangensis]
MTKSNVLIFLLPRLLMPCNVVNGVNRHYGYLFEEPVDEISGDILIDLENLPPEMKQTILLLVKNAADRDAPQKALSDIMK